jgi:hypothetical protein
VESSEYLFCRPAELLETVGGQRAIFLQLVEIFKRDGAEKLADMRQATLQGDLARLAFSSHAFKGTVGPVGCDPLIGELVRIEEECRRGQCSCDERVFAGIELQLRQVENELQRFIASTA